MDTATLRKQVNFMRLRRRLRTAAIKGQGDIYACAMKTPVKGSTKENKKIISPRRVSNGQSSVVRNYLDRGAKRKGNGSVSRESSISDASPNTSDHSSTSVPRNSSPSSMTDILLSEIKMLASTAGHQSCTEGLGRRSTSKLHTDSKTCENDRVSKDIPFISYYKHDKCEKSRRSPTSDGKVLASTQKMPTADGEVLVTSTPKACPVSRAKPKKRRKKSMQTTAKRARSDQHEESVEPNTPLTANSLSIKCGDIRTLSPTCNAFDKILTLAPNKCTLIKNKNGYSRTKTAKRRKKSMIETKHRQNDKCTTLSQTPELKRLAKMKEKNQKLVDFLVCDTCKEYVKNIFCGKVKSKLHTTFTEGSLKQKRAIKHQGFGPIEDEEQIDAIVMTYVDWLTEVNTNPYLQIVGYVLDVWVPEAVVLGLKKVKSYGKSKAWEMFRKGVRSTKAELNSMIKTTHSMSSPYLNLHPPNKTVKRLVLR